MNIEKTLEQLWMREEKTLSEMNEMFAWIDDLMEAGNARADN